MRGAVHGTLVIVSACEVQYVELHYLLVHAQWSTPRRIQCMRSAVRRATFSITAHHVFTLQSCVLPDRVLADTSKANTREASMQQIMFMKEVF